MSDDELAWDLEAAAVLAEFDAAKGEAMNNDPDWLNNQSFRDQAAYEALAAHDAEQAQADDWQHLKPYGYAPGNYMSRCRTCGDTPVMDKRAITCRPCAEAKFAASQAQAERVGLTDEQIEPKAHAGEPVVPYLYVYEYDSPFGLNREFYPSGWNGQKPTRTVPLYTTPQPAQAERVGLTDEQIAEGRYRTWAAEPEDAPEAWSFFRGARWAESALAVRWGVKLAATTGEQQ